MPNDINELDEQDVGLKGIFGNRFHDATSDTEPSKKQESTYTSEPVKTEQSGAHKRTVRDAKWEPVYHDPDLIGSLKASVKSVFVFGGLNLLIFYWQQAELMDETIALPSMIVCAVLAGWGVGRNFAKELR